MTKKKKRPIGRPPTGRTPARSIRLSRKIWDAVDKWQRIRIDDPALTTSMAVRKLLQIALYREGISERSELED